MKYKAAVVIALAMGWAVAGDTKDIVVTGRSLSKTAADLEACIKRHCPPDQDVAASLAHAENQFVAGNYGDSRTTLKKALGRNRGHKVAYPVPVSDLLRANSRIAEHMGEAKDYQLSVLDMRDILKQAFGAGSTRALSAQLDVGDSRSKLGFPDEAEHIYRDVDQQAQAAGQNRIATLARIRQALLLRVRYEDSPNTYLRRQLDERLDQISLHPLAGAEEFALVAEVIRARLDRNSGSVSSTEALIKRFAQAGGITRPLLLFAEPLTRIDLSKIGTDNSQSTESWHNYSANNQGSWADVGFWIGADGHVSDVDVLRYSGSNHWLKPVLASVSKRIYAPLKQGDDSQPGFYMIERYTLTARVSDDVTGTHMRMREATPRVEMLDLTPDNALPAAKKG